MNLQRGLVRAGFSSMRPKPDGSRGALWLHNPNLPIGSVQITDSDVCFRIDGKLVLGDPQARISLAHLKAKTSSNVLII